MDNPPIKKSSRLTEFLLFVIAVLSCLGTYLAVPGLAPMLFVTPTLTREVQLQTREIPQRPTVIALANTPPGSILQPGEAWLENNLELTLLHVNRNGSVGQGCNFSLEFTFKNHSAVGQIVTVDPSDFQITDNAGVTWTGVGISSSHACLQENEAVKFIVNIPPGGAWNYEGGNSWVVWFDEAAFQSEEMAFAVEAKNILDVEAHWVIHLTP